MHTKVAKLKKIISVPTTAWMPISQLKFPRPTKRHRENDLNYLPLLESVKKHGLKAFVGIDQDTHRVIWGVNLVYAAIELGFDSVPVNYIPSESAEAIKAALPA